METIKTKNLFSLSYDYNFQDYLLSIEDNATFGYIHSIFHRVINVYNGSVIIPIVKKDIGNGPYTLRVNFPKGFSFNDLSLKKGDKVKKIGNQLLFKGDLIINISNNDIWNYNKRYILEINPKIIRENYNLFKEILILKGAVGGCRYNILKEDIDIKANIVEIELSRSIDKFIVNIEEDCEKNIEDNLRALVGLGIGLTPSGDDFLTGFINTLSRIKTSSNIFGKLIKKISEMELSTTDISISMLKASLKREAREELLNFIYGFCEKDPERFKGYLYNLLDIGSSSGTDLAVGIALAYKHTILK